MARMQGWGSWGRGPAPQYCGVRVNKKLFRDVVQMARMQGWGSWGRWFESSHPEIIPQQAILSPNALKWNYSASADFFHPLFSNWIWGKENFAGFCLKYSACHGIFLKSIDCVFTASNIAFTIWLSLYSGNRISISSNDCFHWRYWNVMLNARNFR